MPAIDISRWLAKLLEQLQRSRQRQLVILEGTPDWCDAQLPALYRSDTELLVISNRQIGADPIPLNQAELCLGGEARILVLDLFGGFNADVFCIAAGLVRAGGVLVLLTPALADWDLGADEYACWQDECRSRQAYFVDYFFSALEQDPGIGIKLTEASTDPAIPELAELQATPIIGGQTPQQAQARQTIEQWFKRKSAGIVLLSAARGRGKSTCLGQLAQRLLDDGYRVLVSASSRRAAAQLLHWAPRAEFVAPDRLLQETPGADLLVIDEAAMIPQSVLQRLRRAYPRQVIATTHGGYEGTGQGFRLRFVAELQANLLELSFSDPVRWCPGDALEAWIEQTLMLHRDPAPQIAAARVTGEVEYALIANPGEMSQIGLTRDVYRLMSSAHYRTRPSDLRMLMENPGLVLLVAHRAEHLLGAVLLNPEGGFDAALGEQVYLGRRRPRGHLLAQMLTAQAGIRDFAQQRGLRIQRIAVAAEVRRQGVGSGLLERAARFAHERNYAWLGASFALDPGTAGFWQQAGFALVHVSFAEGKSSGRHSIAVLRAMTGAIDESIDALRQRLRQQLPTWLTQFLQAMDAGQVATLLRGSGYSAELSRLERAEVEAFTGGNKGFELCFASLQRFVMHRIAQSEAEPDHLLIEKAVQNRSWNQLERESGARGRKQLQQRLRGLVEALNKAC